MDIGLLLFALAMFVIGLGLFIAGMRHEPFGPIAICLMLIGTAVVVLCVVAMLRYLFMDVRA